MTVASFAIEAAVDPLLLRVFPEALPNADALSSNTWARTLTFAYGFLSVAAGGYVAARLARRSPVAHATVMGIVQAGLTVVAMLSPAASHASPVQWIAIAILSILSAAVGGVLCRRSVVERPPAHASAVS